MPGRDERHRGLGVVPSSRVRLRCPALTCWPSLLTPALKFLTRFNFQFTDDTSRESPGTTSAHRPFSGNLHDWVIVSLGIESSAEAPASQPDG